MATPPRPLTPKQAVQNAQAKSNDQPAATTSANKLQLPNYTDLFGKIDKAEGLEARSVLSPAAYLVDLLQLHDAVANAGGPDPYRERRLDVDKIPLDDASTYREIPALDVSNQLMSDMAEGIKKPVELELALFPAPLPYAASHERLKTYLVKLGTDLAEMYRAYQAPADGYQVARLRLGLSTSEYDLFTTIHESQVLADQLWGIRKDEERAALVAGVVDKVRARLGLSPKDLRAVVYQQLSEAEIQDGAAAKKFFINRDPDHPNTFLTLVPGDDGGTLEGLSDGRPLVSGTPVDPRYRHLDRLMRFVRLSKRLQMEPADLDQVLQTACNNTLDRDAIWAIAVARELAAKLNLPMEQVCCLWTQPRPHGKGDDPEPRDPFDRVFNLNYAQPLETLLAQGFDEKLRGRLLSTLRISRADYELLTAALAGRGAAPEATIAYVALLYRMTSLARALSLPIKDLIELLDVLEAQWSTSAHDDLAVPVPPPPAAETGEVQHPAFWALSSPDAPPRAALNVLERLVRLKEWMDQKQLSVRQSAFICLAGPGDGAPVDGVASPDAIEAALSDLSQALLSTLVHAADLRTGSLSADGAVAVFEALRQARVLEVLGEDGAPAAGALIRRDPSAGELESILEVAIQEHLAVFSATLRAAGVPEAGVQDLLELLQERGYIERLSEDAYRIPSSVAAFFLVPSNLDHFFPDELEGREAVFKALAERSQAFRSAGERVGVEAKELSDRLLAAVDGQWSTLQQMLALQLALQADLAGALFAFVFGTPDETRTQTLASLTVPLMALKSGGAPATPALSVATIGVRFRRLQQFALLAGKAGLTADEANTYLKNQDVHRSLPETLPLPPGFIEAGKAVDVVTTLDNGEVLVTSGAKQVRFSGKDYGLSSSGTLADGLPGLPLPAGFQSGLDCAWRDPDGKLYLCAGTQFLSSADPQHPRRIADVWGRVRNLIQQDQRVDAAFQDGRGRVFLFRGDQYARYSDPSKLGSNDAVVDERYPRSILKFGEEDVAELPALMHARVDAAFRDADGSYYFFSGDKFTHSKDPYAVRAISTTWGIVRNLVFDDARVDAAFVSGDQTYLVRGDQILRYTGGAYGFADERFPVSFGNIPAADPLLQVLKRFPAGVEATLVDRRGALHAFGGGLHASSSAPDDRRPIKERWGLVRNRFQEFGRVDAALSIGGVVYLFCDDQYVRYSTSSYQYVDKGYPRRVHANWNARERIGSLPDGLPDPIAAVATDRSGDVYFFAGNQFAGPDGSVGPIKDRWARVRNNIERLGRVDASLIDDTGRLYLFTADQMYRYSSPGQDWTDEGYPLPLASGWAKEGPGWSVPQGFGAGISACLRAPDKRVFFFSGTQYARVDTAAAPQPVSKDWGLVRNWIADQGRVNAAFCDPQGKTYLFGGDQFYRYSDASYVFLDEGFPLAISSRWGDALPASFRAGVDAALSFRSGGAQRVFLFKGTDYVRYTGGNYAQVDAGYPKPIANGDQYEGAWFRGFAVNIPDDHAHNQPLIAITTCYTDTYLGQPRCNVFYYNPGDGRQRKREYRVDNNGQYGWTGPVYVDSLTEYGSFTRLSAAFQATDGTLHLFSDQSFVSRSAAGQLSAPAPIKDRWARVFNQIADLGRVDATLAGC